MKNKQTKLIITSFHWGVESTNYPNDVQQHLAKYAIDCGVDLVLGHHPNVILRKQAKRPASFHTPNMKLIGIVVHFAYIYFLNVFEYLFYIQIAEIQD